MTNSLNQYESITQGGSSISLDYDDDGNLIHKDGVQYVFNCENRLVEVAPLAPTIGDTRVTFAYDYMGRRYLKQSFIYASGEWSLVSTATSVWEGWNRIQEKVVLASDGSEETTSWIWGLDLSQTLQGAGGVGGLLAVVDDASDVDFFLYDANGNVGQLVNALTGDINAAYEYDPFGRLINAQGSKANQNPYRFSTKPFDVETGLYYYGYRHLDVDLGRWVSRDPIGERGGWNLLHFCFNSVFSLIDTLGLEAAIVPDPVPGGPIPDYSPKSLPEIPGSNGKPAAADGYATSGGVIALLNTPISKLGLGTVVGYGLIALDIGLKTGTAIDEYLIQDGMLGQYYFHAFNKPGYVDATMANQWEQEKDRKKCHRGRIQAQGNGVNKSVPWAQNTPLTISQAKVLFLTLVKVKLTPYERYQRTSAIIKASEFMIQSSRHGGIGPGQWNFYERNFTKKKSEIDDPGATRIDIEVNRGLAFTPG